ncbi:MAG: TonB-dependent receptor plug domain-containing protein [Saprospiraceae bacterium]|nr:TonB-dependent receptor plug domain-containing protein [Saprospiraceae bacterium]
MKYIFFFLFIFSLNSHSQSILRGFVKDSSNSPYIDLEVYISQLNLKTFTDETGYYQFASIPEGEYAISFDYGYDKEYRKIVIEKVKTEYNIILERRINFNEVTILQSRIIGNPLNSSHALNDKEISTRITEKDIPYILESLPNAQVQSDAGNGVGYTEFRIRGIDPQHIQYSLNGIPLNDAESSRTYLVDIPDIANSTDQLTVYSGYVPGRSGNGAFGASVDLFTNKLYFKPFANIKTRFGSFNTSGFSLHANTGLIEDKFNVEIRISGQKSDGFIERSGSRLKSFALSGTKIKKNYSLSFNIFNGKEITQQAWNGLPFKYFEVDSLYRYNSAGRERPGDPYNDETDNYNQTHVQFFYNHTLGSYNLNFTGNYTSGKGFFENYKADQLLSDYALIHSDTFRSDIVRQKWLDNDFYYSYLGIDREWNKKWKASMGFSYSKYVGNHFGQAIWSPLTMVENIGASYYFNEGIKNEFSGLLKVSFHPVSNLQLGLDGQFRNIQYTIRGNSKQFDTLNIENRNNLFSPKLFTRWIINNKFTTDLSISYFEREPNRQDLLTNNKLSKEKLLCLDAGISYLAGKKSIIKLNAYNMSYFNYLALNGELNDTGDPLRINIPNARRTGIELSSIIKEWEKFSLHYSLALSENISNDYTKLIPEYKNDSIHYIRVNASKVNLAFSPQFIQSIGAQFYAFGNNTSKHAIVLGLQHKYVDSQNLDLSNSNFASIPSYNTIQLRIHYNFNSKVVKGLVYFQINNVINTRYSSHGWLSSYYSESAPTNDPYTAYDNNIVYLKSLYPQALRHYSMGVDILF